MARSLAATTLVAALLAGTTTVAQDEFVPEEFTVKERLDPGPKLFFMEQNQDGASRFHIWSAEGEMPYLGQFTTGAMAQGTVNQAGTKGYAMGIYMDRITRGEFRPYLQVFDIDTLALEQEIALPDRAAMVNPYAHLIQLSADERYVYVQNGTPAASVTVVDVTEGNVLAEVPTPGCWSIYPARTGAKFSSLCGDGTATSYVVADDGSFETFKSETIFDVDEDPLFVHAERRGDELLFVSYQGNVYRISDEGDAPALAGTFSITEGVSGDWGVTGYSVLAYNEPHDVLFVMMQADPSDGSHKDPASEVWAVKVGEETTLYRSSVQEVTSIIVSGDETPVLYAFSEEEGVIVRFEIDPDAKYAIKPAAARNSEAGHVMNVRF